MNIYKNLFLISIVSLLTACGGGGGGGSGGGDEPGTSRRGARILHGAIEGSPVDLVSSLQGIVKTSRFADNTEYTELQSGTQILNLYRTKDLTSPLATRQITNSGDQKQTVVFYGDRDNFGLRASIISEEFPEVPEGVALVRIIHAVVGASSLEASLSSGTIIAGFGSASTYGTTSPGLKSISVIRSADRTVIDGVSFTAQEGKAYTIFVAGEIGYLVISRLLEEN
jgi:hypothetical protein